MNFKRANKLNTPTFLVSNSNLALATTGNKLFGTGTSMNISNDQLGIVDLTTKQTITGDMNAAGVSRFKFVQGTPASSNISLADNGFEYGHKTHVQSQELNTSNIRSISTYKPSLGTKSVQLVVPSASVEDGTLYGLYIDQISSKNERHFGYNRNIEYYSYTTLDYTSLSTTSPLDHMVQNLVAKVNAHSIFTKGNENFVVLGLKLAGGAAGGVDLGTISTGDSLPFLTLDGTTYNYTFQNEDIATLQELIANSSSIATTTELVHVNPTTAGAADNCDAFILIGLDSPKAIAYDDILNVKTRLNVNLSDQFLIDSVKSQEIVFPKETKGLGSNLLIDYNMRAALNVGDMQVVPRNEYYPLSKVYIKEDVMYTQTRVDYFDWVDHMSGKDLHNKTCIILLPCTVAVTDVATPITYTTTASTTVSNLNTALAPWLASSNTNNIEYNGVATQAAPFA